MESNVWGKFSIYHEEKEQSWVPSLKTSCHDARHQPEYPDEIYQFYIFPWSVGKVYLSMRLINLICFCSQSVTKLFNVEFLFSQGI